MKNLVKAVLAVMQDCKGIDKSMTVGTGRSSYKGVSDKDVKLTIGESMRKNGLVIFPTKINPSHTIERWEEETQYGVKQKQSVFTEVVTDYLLMHESGESVSISGYGHGVDSQDKAAGKATTYAMKYVLLYTFMVATGYIDDTDNTHSASIPTPSGEKKISQWERSRSRFITAVKKEADNVAQTNVISDKIVSIINKAQSMEGASNEDIMKALEEAGWQKSNVDNAVK